MKKRKQRTLEQISLGELKMEDAGLTYRISKTQEDITLVDEAIKSKLEECNSNLEPYQLEKIGHDVTGLIQKKQNLIQNLDSFSKKRIIVQKLISMKEESTNFFPNIRDIVDTLDIEDVLSTQEKMTVNSAVQSARTMKLLKNNGGYDHYNDVLSIIRSISYDDESISSAKMDLEKLIEKETL